MPSDMLAVRSMSPLTAAFPLLKRPPFSRTGHPMVCPVTCILLGLWTAPEAISIIDLLGREMSSISLGLEVSKIISLQNVMLGMYYFIVSDGSESKKIIVGQ